MKSYNKIISKLLFMITCFIIMISLSCSPKVLPATAEVHYKGSKDQTITLTSVGYVKDKRTAIFNAEKNAFDVLLFRGVPGSAFSKPLIQEGASSIKSAHADFFKTFYEDLGYRSFMKNSIPISPGSNDKQTKSTRAGVEITINIPSLRRELEQKGIIHKFGL